MAAHMLVCKLLIPRQTSCKALRGQKVVTAFCDKLSTDFYRAACNATHGIAVAILSVGPSVRLSDACIVKKIMHCRYFDNTQNGNHSSFPTPTLVGGRYPLPCQIFAESDPPSLKNADFDRFPLITSQQ